MNFEIIRRGRKALNRLIPRTKTGDKLFSLVMFIRRHKRLPRKNLLNDYLFNLKASNEISDPLRVFVSDKEHLKTYIKSVVGDKHNVPTIHILRSKDDIDEFDFPARCCIKPTHASNSVIIRSNGEPLDIDAIKSWMDINFYLVGRERNYKYLKPKIIIEPLIFDRSNIEDYKIFCFEGEPKLIQVDIDRHDEHTRIYFDANWNKQDFSILFPLSNKEIKKPKSFELMLNMATELSKEFSLIRVDLYTDGEEVLVGELTNCPEDAGAVFIPKSAERRATKIIFGTV